MESAQIMTVGAISIAAFIAATFGAFMLWQRSSGWNTESSEVKHCFTELRAVNIAIIDTGTREAARGLRRMALFLTLAAICLGVASLSIPVIGEQAKNELYRNAAAAEKAYPPRTAAIAIIGIGALTAAWCLFECTLALRSAYQLKKLRHHPSLEHVSVYDTGSQSAMRKVLSYQSRYIRDGITLTLPVVALALLIWTWTSVH